MYISQQSLVSQQIMTRRRSQLLSVAAGAALLAVPGAAHAIVKGFEPMAAIKGKDYGKQRQR